MRDPFPAWSGKNSRRSRRISRRGALHRKGERNFSVLPPFQESPRSLSPFQRNLFSLHCLDFHAEDRLPPRWHVGPPCGKAWWEGLVGKPRGKATDPLIHATGRETLLVQLGRKAHFHAPIRDEVLLPWGDSTSTPRSMSALERNPQVPGPTPHKVLSPGIERGRNPERPPSTSHGEGPFLRPPERVPEVPLIIRKHLPQLEKIQEVLGSRRDEAHFP